MATTTRNKTASTTTKNTAPSREDVARRAYEIYLARKGAPGSALDDWRQAERELGLVSLRHG